MGATPQAGLIEVWLPRILTADQMEAMNNRMERYFKIAKMALHKISEVFPPLAFQRTSCYNHHLKRNVRRCHGQAAATRAAKKA